MHIVRDGRDVVCSLLEKPWLRRGEEADDDAGIAYGSYARFWVEPERRAEFESSNDARRAAWVWRRYVTAARSSGAVSVELRYEELAEDPEGAASRLTESLGTPRGPLLLRLRGAHALVGRPLST